MKNIAFTGLVCLLIAISSCNKEVDSIPNFYNEQYRRGLWINASKTDTLRFVNQANLIRQGSTYVYEEYLYRIENNLLYIKLPDYPEIETQHPIKEVDGNRITLGNMRPTLGFADGSETYYKE